MEGSVIQLVKFLASETGRWVRIVAGIVLVAAALLIVQNTGGIVLAVVGLVPLVAGLIDVCACAPLFGLSLSGKVIRSGH